MSKKIRDPAILNPAGTEEGITEVRRQEALLITGALQNAILNSANFSSIATDEKGIIQLFNVGAERMLGYTAADVMNKITPADISDPQELIARAKALSVELAATITPSFEALVFKAEVPFLKATKPTTTPSMQRKDSHERRNEHTVQIPSHRAGQ